MRINLRVLRTEFESLIPSDANRVVLNREEISDFWSTFNAFVKEIKEEYVKKLPESSPEKFLELGRLSILEELLSTEFDS
jgi:hypothetical protein